MSKVLKYDYIVLIVACLIWPLFLKAVPSLLGLFGLFQLIKFLNPTFKQTNQWSVKDFWLVFPYILFYLVHVIGLVWTEDMSHGWFNLQVKLSFLLIPVVMLLLNKTNWPHTRIVLKAFVAGVVIAGIIYLIRAFYIFFFVEEWIQHFFGSRLCFTMHVGYYATYLIVSSLIVFFDLYENWKSGDRRFRSRRIGLLVFLFLLVMLTSAKNQIITYIILVVIITIVFYGVRNPLKGFLAVLVAVILFGVILRNSEKTFLRFRALFKVFDKEYVIDKNQTESTAVRLAVWEASVKYIGEHSLLGSGTGDDDWETMAYYKSNGYYGAYEKSMNAHNQFLESTIKLGIPGLISVCVLFFMPLIRGIKRRNHLLVYTSIGFTLIALTESIFEVQAGVIGYCLIMCLLDVAGFNDDKVGVTT